MRTSQLTLILGISLLSGVACSSAATDGLGDGGYASGGDFGATQGGVQDLTFARKLVQEGRVPPPEAMPVEGMFSEHDLPLSGAPCATTLCLRSGMGVKPASSGAPAAWVQVGMSSTIDPGTYQRPSLAVVAAVDVSGSMSFHYGTESPGEIARALLASIAAELGEVDSMTIVTYGSTVSVALDTAPGGSPAIDTAIAALAEGGSTNMEAGMQAAYAKAGGLLGTADEVRVMLFTDAQPNVGATTASEFQSLAEAGASQGIGLTVFGVGLGLGAELMGAMSTLRGGNAFSLTEPDDVATVMEDSWPWMASPIAYDLVLRASPGPDLALAHGYGFPGLEPGSSEPKLEVASVFLSKRKGAMLLELAPVSGEALDAASVSIELAYTDRDGQPHSESLTASYAGQALDGRGAFFPQPSIDKTVALAQLTQAMRDATTTYATDQDQAVAMLATALERFEADAAVLEDPAIDAEAAFWPKLLENMKAGALQGDMYGGL